ncbi:MAG: hypothetical protein ACI9FJ_000635 [Alteromonadaceae bacterium]|jgi:hypothetical protein
MLPINFTERLEDKMLATTQICHWDFGSNFLAGISVGDQQIPAVDLAPAFYINAVLAQIELRTGCLILAGEWFLNKTPNGAFFLVLNSPLLVNHCKGLSATPEVVGILCSLDVLQSLSNDLGGLWPGYYQNLQSFVDHSAITPSKGSFE